MSESLLLFARNRVREEAFSSLRKVKRLLFLHNAQRGGDSYLREMEEEKKRSEKLFRKWKALERRVKDEDL